MSSGPFKETFKALITTFSEPAVPRSLPFELLETIHIFLNKHTSLEDTELDRIHEDLLLVYKQHVAKDTDKLSPWLVTLKTLRPALLGERNLEDWWTLVVRPVLAEIGHKRDVIEDARAFVLAVTLYDTQEDGAAERARESRLYINLLLQAFLARTQLPSAGVERNLQEDEFVAQELENVLVIFGRKMPKNLLKAIDSLLVKSESRLQALSLLSSFVRLQPPHLHLVLETELPRHLLNCLLIDTSATVVDLAMSVLIMFLPHITSALISLLPKLFLVYARVLCWDDFGYEKNETIGSAADDEKTEASSTAGVFEQDASWEPFRLKTENIDGALPRANYLFTFLYGLFPLNFMTFIRKPRRYLKMKSYPTAETLGLNQGMIRARTEAHRTSHLLHPSFFSTTPEDELVDNKWLKSDPADLVSECLSLSLDVSSTMSDPGPPPSVGLPPLPPSNAHARVESETIPSSMSGLSPTIDAASFVGEPINVPPRRSSRASLLGRSRRSSPTAVDGAEAKPAASLMDVQDANATLSMLEKATGMEPSGADEKSAHMRTSSGAFIQSPIQKQAPFHVPSPGVNAMQREIMLLRNDLNLERYLKQQHIMHIGQMQRKHISEAAVEADTQNLINTNRNLQQKLTKANELYAQLKKETTTSRSQAKRYEETLSAKLKVYREEEKRLKTEIESLRVEYDKLKAECEDMRSLVVESEIREHHTRNALTTLQREFEATDLLRKQIGDLESRVQDYELRNLDYERNKDEDHRLRNELETTRMELESRDADQERTHKLYEQKISLLEARLRTAVSTAASGQMPSSVQQMIDSALAASNSKLAQLKRAHQRLLQKYTELELQAQELQGNHQVLEHEHEQLRQQQRSQSGSRDGVRPTSVLSLTQYADDAAPLGLNDSPVRRQISSRGPQRKLHAFTDPARFERADSIPEDDYIEELSPQRLAFGYEKAAASAVSLSQSGADVSGITKRPSQTLASRSAALNADRIERLTTDRSNLSSAGTATSQAINTRPFETNVQSISAHDFAAPRPLQQLRTPSGGMRAAGTLNSLVSKHSFGPEIGGTGAVRYSGRGGAQSTLKKSKEKEKDKDKEASRDKVGTKSGGFRGLKGIM